MTDVTPLRDVLEAPLRRAFSLCGYDDSLGSLRLSDRPDLCDYQCNGAFLLAKSQKKNPRTIAEDVLKHLTDMSFGDISIAGAGFINITLSDDYLCKKFSLYSPSSPIQKKKETIVLDYGGPNIAKPMHVGHLRSAIIGDALKRLCRFLGHTVIADIHLGDWGTQIGMVILELMRRFPHLTKSPITKDTIPPISLDDLQCIYPHISKACKEDPALRAKASEITHALQNGHEGYRCLWSYLLDISCTAMKEQYTRLNVSFDLWYGESRYQKAIPPLLEKLTSEKIAIEDNGALVVPMPAPMPPYILRKADGGYLYATTDLATLVERVVDMKASRVIYVVDGRQHLHFSQLFETKKRMALYIRTDFLGYGTMNGEDNKPFKTRSGGVMRLSDLISLLTEKASAHIPNPEDALKVGVAAIKFADLQHDPAQNYKFSLDSFMRFEGKTGPYLLYACARMRSLLEKAGDYTPTPFSHLSSHERELVFTLLTFHENINSAYKKLSPKILCDLAFDIAQKFSRFYQNTSVLQEEKNRNSRLTLISQCLSTLERILSLLGIDTPKRM